VSGGLPVIPVQPVANVPTSGRGSNYGFDGAPSPVRRLSREEIVATIGLLTGETPAKSELPAEQKVLHQVTHMSGQSYASSELPKLREAMAGFARPKAVAVLTRTNCKQTQQVQRDCLAAWGASVAQKAWRRALSTMEMDELKGLATEADGTVENDAGAVEGLLMAVFFSPSFLYRNEIGAPGPAMSYAVLTDQEIASKLSFTAAGLPPDAELIAAAQSGALRQPEGRVAQYNRLAASPAGIRTHALLILDWAGAADVNGATKNPAVTEGLPADAFPSLRSSALAAVEAVLRSSAPTLPNILNTTSYSKDPVVAAISGAVTRSGTDFGDTALTKRQGLLMHPYVVAAHAKEGAASVFAIGSFIREALLCEKLGSPPPDATSQVRGDQPAGLTQRQTLEYKTSPAARCTSCHAQFAPLGFAFAAFDPVGRWRVNEPTGSTWDLSGTSPLSWSAEPLAFQGPSEMSTALGTNAQVQGCFAHRLMSMVLGREPAAREIALSQQLDEVAVSTQGNPFEVLRSVVRSPEFIIAN
jgi:Protein of unknown function (DUF1588)/Protein of unknown function (DUF1592)/Protein of unknown function (DUF1595)/Protein of unknown function (DUF1585)